MGVFTNMEINNRYKMYKSGKLWLTTALATFAFAGGVLSLNQVDVRADTVNLDEGETQTDASSNQSVVLKKQADDQ